MPLFSRSPILFKAKALFGLLFFMLSLPIWAGEVLQFTVKQSNAQETISILLQGAQARIISSANTQSAVLFDANTKQLQILDHQKQQITRVDQASLDQLASIIEGVGAMARSQGGVLGDLFKTFGMDNDLGEQVEIKTIQLAKKGQYSGVSCDLFEVYEREEKVTKLCLAKDMDMQSAERETLKALIGFTQLLLQKGQMLLDQFGLGVPVLPTKSLNGVPIFIHDKQKNTTAILAGHKNQAISAAEFKVPSGYQETQFGF